MRPKINYTSGTGFIYASLQATQNLSQLSIIDTLSNTINNAFTNYAQRGVVDLEKSYFTLGALQIYAGNSTTVTVSLVDSMFTPVNLTGNVAALSNLSVVLIT
jgi:hypothetical protein